MTEAIVELRRVKEHMCDLLAWFSIGRWWTSYNFWQRMETLASRVINQFTLGFTWKRKRKITWPVTFPSINMSIVSFSTAISNNPHNVLWLRAIPFQPSHVVLLLSLVADQDTWQFLMKLAPSIDQIWCNLNPMNDTIFTHFSVNDRKGEDKQDLQCLMKMKNQKMLLQCVFVSDLQKPTRQPSLHWLNLKHTSMPFWHQPWCDHASMPSLMWCCRVSFHLPTKFDRQGGHVEITTHKVTVATVLKWFVHRQKWLHDCLSQRNLPWACCFCSREDLLP